MFYWVKSPNGQESDYNAQELRKALEEGRVQPGWPARGDEQTTWSNVATVLEQVETEPEEAPPAKYASFVCGRCRSRLRLELPLKETPYTCPECDTVYQAGKVSEDPLIFVLMPDLKEYDRPSQDTPPPRQKTG